MNGLIKAALICGGLIGAAIGLAKVNDIYKEHHDGRGMVEDALDTMEKHPVATATVGIATIVLATCAMQTYEETHRTPEWYAHQEKIAETRAQVRMAEMEEDRKREEFERLQEDKARMDQLNFYRQMPAEYWSYRSSIEDRKAREKESKAIVESAQYVSDNELEAAKYVSDNELEAKKVKSKAKSAKEEKEEIA